MAKNPPFAVVALALAATFVGAIAGCVSPISDVKQVAAPPDIIRSSVRFQKEYILAAGDQVEVLVWRTPEASRTVVIRPDGHISLPLLQEVRAEGLTPRELAANVQAALAKRLVNPEVNVIPLQVRQATVYVLGDVRAPGAFPIRNAPTAAQAVALAGGAQRSASEGDVTIIRLSEDGYLEAVLVVNQSMLSQPGPFLALAATKLRADDIVFVPEHGRSQVMRLLADLLVPIQIYLNYKLIKEVL